MKDDDDIDVEREFGFEPAVSATGAAAAPSREKPRPRKRRGRLRRRLGATAVLSLALVSMGSLYAAFAASPSANDTGLSKTDIQAGRQLYQVSCITCHGANLDGIVGQGPSLIGVGGAAVYFQVSTGRMPATGQGAENPRKEAKFDEQQTEQLAAYVESVGGGPSVPQGSLRGPDDAIAEGGVLYRLNCASCHGVTGKGAPLSAGKVAPSLNDATDRQMVTAMLSGPEQMPVFSNNQLTPDQKRAIVAYIQTLKASKDPGGAGIDRIGPVSEAIVAWVGGVGAIMIAILWIGARNR
ncbi:MAG TPA: c-type cytochrome [Jatrophihabitans sp.]|nr:c-type cytochrome [Jatrophihabitans sp.]